MRPALALVLIVSTSQAALARPGDVAEPFVVPSVPFVHRSSTVGRASNIAKYSCLATASEGGPEVAYVFRAPSAGRLLAIVEGDTGSVDIDVHILSSLRTDGARMATNCLARGNQIAETDIAAAGDAFIVVDTYQAASHAGPYTLRIGFQPDGDWTSRPVARGVSVKTKTYADLFGARQSTSVIEIDLAEPSVVVKPILAATCTTTSALARAAGAVAAINAGFFDTSTGRCGSVSLVKIDGQLLARNAKSRTAFGIDTNKRPLIERVNAGADWPAAVHAVGGVPRIVSAGSVDVKTVDEGSPLSFGTARHPRTAVGITGSGGLVFATVDGRTSAGAGMSLTELAQWMIWLGVANAVNLDGGGSTTMWVKGEPWGGVVNYPSDNGRANHAGERAVGSALGVWAAPLDRDVAWLTPTPARVRLRPGETWTAEWAVADPEGRAAAFRAVAPQGIAPGRLLLNDRDDGTARVSFTAEPSDRTRSPLNAAVWVDVAGGRSFSKTVAIVIDALAAPDAGSPLETDAGSPPEIDAGSVEPQTTDAGALPPPLPAEPQPADAGAPTTPPTVEPALPIPGTRDDTNTGCALTTTTPNGVLAFASMMGAAAVLLVTRVSRRRDKAREDTRSARGQ
jgi:hypothetical protein